jgi:hypothetical protein
MAQLTLFEDFWLRQEGTHCLICPEGKRAPVLADE